jgi:hypothetical protein
VDLSGPEFRSGSCPPERPPSGPGGASHPLQRGRPLPRPDTRTRLVARLAFGPATERLTWSAVRVIMRVSPDVGLPMLLRDLTVLSPRHARAPRHAGPEKGGPRRIVIARSR